MIKNPRKISTQLYADESDGEGAQGFGLQGETFYVNTWWNVLAEHVNNLPQLGPVKMQVTIPFAKDY